ncbi:MAG: Dam family site-specific DNA-(adenine-N6)-methyltransferase [Acidobacteriota bacterium]
MAASKSAREPSVKPFLRWPGGKRWLAPIVARYVTRHLAGTYREPFLGGGAVFFDFRPPQATLSDVNEDLVLTYEIVRDKLQDILPLLESMPISQQYYNALRKCQPGAPLDRAARFLYLNRVAFSGIYRVNSKGQFNVPFGGDRGLNVFWRDGLLNKASMALKNTQLRSYDFRHALVQCAEGDVAYCDPTYTVRHDNNGFIRYNERNFSWSDQLRLAKAAQRAADRGAVVIISNAHHAEVRALYRTAITRTVCRNSLLAANSTGRQPVKEHLFILGQRR